MPDFASYIGIPFVERGRDRSGLDCWGLVVLFYQEHFGIELESHTEDYATTKDRELMAALMRHEAVSWPEVPLEDAITGDVLMLRIKGQPWHCGVMIATPYFLHADRKLGVVKDRCDSLTWAKRTLAVHRHQQLVGSTVQ